MRQYIHQAVLDMELSGGGRHGTYRFPLANLPRPVLRAKTTSHFVVAVFLVVRRDLRELLHLEFAVRELSKPGLQVRFGGALVGCQLCGVPSRILDASRSPLHKSPPSAAATSRPRRGVLCFSPKNYIFYFSEKNTQKHEMKKTQLFQTKNREN